MDRLRIFVTVIRYRIKAGSEPLVAMAAANSAPSLKRTKAKLENLSRKKTEPEHQEIVQPDGRFPRMRNKEPSRRGKAPASWQGGIPI
jgi:hypothetical protein